LTVNAGFLDRLASGNGIGVSVVIDEGNALPNVGVHMVKPRDGISDGLE
jgi:hypothetical protein